MSRYSDEDRERVRDAVDMVALVESRTELRRAGSNSYFGCCPFHDERSPSFHVRPEQKHYHCFGCQVSGDPFRFVMETEGVGFREAIELLADRFSVAVEPIEEDEGAAERRRERERLFELLERTTGFYERFFWDSKEAEPARQMLANRGLGRETLLAFRVGYSPSAWDRVLLASREAGFTEQELIAAGLAQKARDREAVFDRFRGRIMFPLADGRGRVLGFGARAMRDEQGPKYLNSSESLLYHKGRQLFGLDVARSAAAKAGVLVLAEGYVDVLSLYEAEVTNAVGLMGTALTEDQASEMERTASVLSLALDADKAGQQAMVRAGRVVAGRKLELRVVPMPEGKDPGDLLVEEGPERLRARVLVSQPFVSFRVGLVLEQADLSSAEGKDRALEELRPILSDQPPGALREELIQRIASDLDLSSDLVVTVIGRNSTPSSSPKTTAPDRRQSQAPLTSGPALRQSQAERAFLALCLAAPDLGHIALQATDIDEHFTGDLERRAAKHLLANPTDPLAGLSGDEETQLASLLSKLLAVGSAMSASQSAIDLEALQLERLRLDRAISRAQLNDPGSATGLARDRERVRNQIDEAVEALERETESAARRGG